MRDYEHTRMVRRIEVREGKHVEWPSVYDSVGPGIKSVEN